VYLCPERPSISAVIVASLQSRVCGRYKEVSGIGCSVYRLQVAPSPCWRFKLALYHLSSYFMMARIGISRIAIKRLPGPPATTPLANCAFEPLSTLIVRLSSSVRCSLLGLHRFVHVRSYAWPSVFLEMEGRSMDTLLLLTRTKSNIASVYLYSPASVHTSSDPRHRRLMSG